MLIYGQPPTFGRHFANQTKFVQEICNEFELVSVMEVFVFALVPVFVFVSTFQCCTAQLLTAHWCLCLGQNGSPCGVPLCNLGACNVVMIKINHY